MARVSAAAGPGVPMQRWLGVPTFNRSIVVPGPRAAVFELMQDYDRRLSWDPFLAEARLIHADAAGVGVKAWCVDHRGRGMETEYVSFDPPSRVAVRMTKGPWIFTKLAGSWIYEEVSESTTRVVFRYHVESRLGRIGDWALSRIFAREMDGRLVALKRALEKLDLAPSRG